MMREVWHFRGNDAATALQSQAPCASTGFWYIRPTPMALAFQRKLVHRLLFSLPWGWDQVAWNEVGWGGVGWGNVLGRGGWVGGVGAADTFCGARASATPWCVMNEPAPLNLTRALALALAPCLPAQVIIAFLVGFGDQPPLRFRLFPLADVANVGAWRAALLHTPAHSPGPPSTACSA